MRPRPGRRLSGVTDFPLKDTLPPPPPPGLCILLWLARHHSGISLDVWSCRANSDFRCHSGIFWESGEYRKSRLSVLAEKTQSLAAKGIRAGPLW